MNSEQSSFDYMSFDPNNLKHNIIKKTERGRKTRCPLPKEPRCEICLDYQKESSEQLISCSVCHAYLHPSCYHIELGPIEMENFTCERCRTAILYHHPIGSYKCFICMESSGVLKKNKITGEFYHCLCLSFISELYEQKENEAFITKANIRKWRYKNSCRYCGEKLDKEKSVIKCSNTKCKGYYHIPCAIEKEMIFSLNFLYKYFSLEKMKDRIVCPFFCSCHNKRLIATYKHSVFNQEEDKKDDMIIEEPTEEAAEEGMEEEKMTLYSFEDSNPNTGRTYENTERKYDPTNDYIESYEECLPSNRAIMDLNFNQIGMEIEKENSNILREKESINNSPKSKMPLEFFYDDSYYH
ncbi:MAG: hypothetical protein MJ252_11805 [archaeon]|nr:hypothetical protein [archaeon]